MDISPWGFVTLTFVSMTISWQVQCVQATEMISCLLTPCLCHTCSLTHCLPPSIGHTTATQLPLEFILRFHIFLVLAFLEWRALRQSLCEVFLLHFILCHLAALDYPLISDVNICHSMWVVGTQRPIP